MPIVRRFPAILLSAVGAAAGLGLWFGLVQAAPTSGPVTRFVAANGSGSFCSQSIPCPLQIGLAQSADADTIYVKQGTYTGSGAAVITVTHSISLYGGWTGNPTGQPLRDPLAAPTTIDAQNSRRGLFVISNTAPTIDGFVIRNGNATGLVNSCSSDSAQGCGGGLFVDRAAAKILHNRFISNTALITTTEFSHGYGGGLFLEQAKGTLISANVFLSNSALLPPADYAGMGGGLALAGYNLLPIPIQNNIFTGNSAYWGAGLALDSSTNSSVTGNLVQNNLGGNGGGLFAWIARGSVLSNTFHGNTGDAPAYLGYFGGTFGANLVTDNLTAAGLEVFNNYSFQNVVVYNNIIAHNGSVGIRASGYVSQPLVVLALNNTLVGSGAGTALVLANGYVTVTADNTLISGFTTGVNISYPLTSTANLFFTLFDTDVAAAGNGQFLNSLTGTAGFLDPANRNYHIGINSAARDQGGPTFVTTDIDGDHRPLGAAIDIGADETRFAYGIFLPLARR